MFSLVLRRVVLGSADADPLGVHASPSLQPMAILWIILLATIGLALRAGLYGRRWNVADSDSRDGGGGPESMIDTCARTLILVLLSLMGLLVLGIMYGNVLGAVPART